MPSQTIMISNHPFRRLNRRMKFYNVYPGTTVQVLKGFGNKQTIQPGYYKNKPIDQEVYDGKDKGIVDGANGG
mgnify:CR=1 FL=1